MSKKQFTSEQIIDNQVPVIDASCLHRFVLTSVQG